MMTSAKIFLLALLQDKLARLAMSRPWSGKLSNVMDKIQVRLDALRERGGR